MLVSISLIVNL